MTHLWDRLAEAAERLAPVQSKYRVVFEHPDEPEACACILVPDPNWLAAALAGNILPPIEAYLRDAAKFNAYCAEHKPEFKTWDAGDGAVGASLDFSWDKVGGAEHPYAEPIGPMTEEEAIEYLIMKDIPSQVWADHDKANKPRFAIVRTETIPTDRTFRNAWRLKND